MLKFLLASASAAVALSLSLPALLDSCLACHITKSRFAVDVSHTAHPDMRVQGGVRAHPTEKRHSTKKQDKEIFGGKCEGGKVMCVNLFCLGQSRQIKECSGFFFFFFIL